MRLIKETVERELLEAWQELRSAVDSFSDAELEQEGLMPGWSVKDLLGHIAFWAEEAARNLRLWCAGRPQEIRRPHGQKAVDAWNEREWQLRKNRPLPVIREEWLQSFEAAREALAAFPSGNPREAFGGRNPLSGFAEDTYKHYREHIPDMLTWRRQIETTEA